MRKRLLIPLGLGAVLALAAVSRELVLRQRERSAREAVREELLGRLRALPPDPGTQRDPVPEGEDAAPLLRAARSALVDLSLADVDPEELHAYADAQDRPFWSEPPAAVDAALARAAPVVALLDEAARRPHCRFRSDEIGWVGMTGLTSLLEMRGRLAAVRGEFGVAVSDLAVLRRFAREAAASPVPDDFWLGPPLVSNSLEISAARLLREVALSPRLDEVGARAVLAAADGEWGFRANGRRMAEADFLWLAHFVVDVFGPDPDAAWKRLGFDRPSALDTLTAPFQSGKSGGKEPAGPPDPPTAAEVRRALAVYEAGMAAIREGDLAAFAPGGRAAEAEVARSGERWSPRGLGVSATVWIRNVLPEAAREEAARALLAVRLFHSREGGLPRSWDEIVPAILPAPPRDPFTSEPLLLETTADGVVIAARAWVHPNSEPVRLEWKRR